MIVVKVGGGTGIKMESVLDDFASIDCQKILVHGANQKLTQIQEKLGRPAMMVTSVSGIVSRYTDPATLEIFEMVYCGSVNKGIVEQLQKRGVNAIGLSGIDGRLVQAKRTPFIKAMEGSKTRIIRDDLSGKPQTINCKLLTLLVDNGFVPVITAPAISEDSQAINVDNDAIASLIAEQMHAAELVYLFEAPGLLKNMELENSTVRHLRFSELDAAMESAQGRMKKKVLAMRNLAGKGIKVFYGDGRISKPITRSLAGEWTSISD